MTPFEMSGPRVAVATIVARNYLSFARVLALSLRAHHPHVRFLVVVAADPDTDWQLEGEPFEIVALDNLGFPICGASASAARARSWPSSSSRF